MALLEEILQIVSQRVTPNEAERKAVTSAAENLRARVLKVAQTHGLDVDVRIDGSIAKDTWVSNEADIDVFMLVSPTLTRNDLETKCLDVVREAAGEHTERYAEHPYVELYVDGIRANIVPCFNVERGKWRSATDRTPHHTRYMQGKLDNNLRREVRLTKKFAKGIGVYGAEIQTSGFSGMLCEILTLHYKSFLNLVSSARSWRTGHAIDLEGYYSNRMEDLKDLFPSSLVVIDPVDKGRNVAAAVSREKMWNFVAASRRFIEKPTQDFFFPPPRPALPAIQMQQHLSQRERDILFLLFGPIDAVVDTLWSQLYKTERSLKNFLRANGFVVAGSACWTNEKDKSIIMIELEQEILSNVYTRRGPPVWREEESKRFIEKHVAAIDTVAGPRIEDYSWLVDKKRSHTSATRLLELRMRDGGREIGISAKIASSVRNGFNIMLNEQITKVYEENHDFAELVTGYLKGRPFWLD